MSGLARLSLQQLVRAAARPTLASTPPIASTSTLVLRPLQSARRTLTISAVLAAKGQGGREVKAKKSPKGKENFVKGGKGKSKAVEEDEDDGDDNWNSGGSSGGGKKAPRRTTEPNEADVIEAEVAKADDKMSKAVGWFSDKYGENVARVRGQVSTASLDSVRVVLSKDDGEVPINQLGTVAVKGNSLVIDVFDSEHTKAIENAIHKANLRGLSPNRVNARQLRIVVPKPSEKDRQELVKSMTTLSEQAKATIRTARGAGLKVTGKDGTAELQTVTEKHTKAIDDLLKKAKAELAE